MNAVAEFPALANTQNLRQIEVDYDDDTATMFHWMKPVPRPCFNREILEEMDRFESRVAQHQGWIQHAGRERKVDNIVFGSRTPGVFNLGGDLLLFMQAILGKDRDALTHYAGLCVDIMFRRISGFGSALVSYSLVQGRAFGGGFECALAGDVIVAEKSSTMSFPEVLFNMFPGMGALSLLGRRIGLRKAEEMMTSGQVYSAKQMYDLGVIDEITEDGTGLQVIRALIKARRRKSNSYRALSLAKREFQPVTHAEMMAIVEIWVDAAMKLETHDLRMMSRLVRAQNKLAASTHEHDVVEQLFAPPRAVMNG